MGMGISMGLLLSIVLAFFVAWLLIKPHLEPEAVASAAAGNGSSSLQGLFDQKQRCVQVIKDLDLDFSTGKISAQDYDRMRAGLSEELAGLLTQIDEQDGKRK